jgi:hypothetical protein
VSGQDGVSIVANLNINIGSFQYTDTDATGGSVAFNNISIHGLVEMTVDVLNAAAFQSAAGAAIGAQDVATNGSATLSAAQVGGIIAATAAATGYTGGDVVQFAFPTVNGDASAVSPTIKVASITTGNGGKSFGSFALNHLDLQGTQVWMYGH